jgi:hypothetical protein
MDLDFVVGCHANITFLSLSSCLAFSVLVLKRISVFVAQGVLKSLVLLKLANSRSSYMSQSGGKTMVAAKRVQIF